MVEVTKYLGVIKENVIWDQPKMYVKVKCIFS